jgi:hypothetical protein
MNHHIQSEATITYNVDRDVFVVWWYFMRPARAWWRSRRIARALKPMENK